MIGRRVFAGLVLFSAVLGLSACSAIEPTEVLRYRLTVEVETPDGVKSAYSVREYSTTDIKVGFTSRESRGQGEAVALDLPGGGTLFALLTGADGDVDNYKNLIWRRVSATMTRTGDIAENDKQVLRIISDWRASKERWDVERDDYPMLVTFKDIKDPTSVARVDPDNLAASFGKGYKLKAITVQVTDEAVTTGIEGRLEWLLDKDIMKNPNWSKLPLEVRQAINGLYSGELSK